MNRIFLLILVLVLPNLVEARNLKRGKKKKVSRVRLDIAILAPEVLPFGVRYRLLPRHFIRGYYAFSTRLHRESKVNQDKVSGVDGLFEIVSMDASMPTAVRYGPHMGIDYMYRYSSKFAYFLGLGRRETELSGEMEADIQVKLLGANLIRPAKAYVKNYGYIEQIGLRLGGEYFFRRPLRSSSLSLMFGAFVPLRTNETYDPEIELKDTFIGRDISSISKNSLNGKKARARQQTSEEAEILRGVMPILGISYRFHL